MRAAVTREALSFVSVFRWSRRTEGTVGFTGFLVEFVEECQTVASVACLVFGAL